MLQDFVPQAVAQYRSYEDAFFNKIKGQIFISFVYQDSRMRNEYRIPMDFVLFQMR
jgi:hypothetical protein